MGGRAFVDRSPVRVAPVWRVRVQLYFLPQGSFLQEMKAGLLLDFGISDGAEQTLQSTDVVELEFPYLDPSEKGPSNGLDHILSTDTPLQCLWQVLLGHPLQGLVVLVTELADDLLI